MFPVVEVDRITFRYFLLFGNTKLFLFCFLSKVALKIFSRADQYGIGPVSYTHLDVYKRQSYIDAGQNDPGLSVPARQREGQRHF